MNENEIRACTPLARKIYNLLQAGQESKARGFLPKERVYELDQTLARKIALSQPASK